MSKLTLVILFVVLSCSQAFAEPPASKNFRASLEAAKARHQVEMKVIELEANLMSEVTGKGSAGREAVAEAAKPAPKKQINKDAQGRK